MIIRVSTPDDYPAISDLLSDVFKDSRPLEQRIKLWEWRYDKNPARTDSIPAFLVSEQSGKILGVHGLTPLCLKIGDHKLVASCSCDFAVDPNARTTGIQIKLRALSSELSPLHISTSANEPANKLTLALGGKEVPVGRRKLIKPLKASGIIARMAGGKSSIAGRMAEAIVGRQIDGLIAFGRMFKSYETISSARIVDIDSFDERFDRLWQALSNEHPIAVVRDAVYLQWRYCSYPFEGIQALALIRDKDLLGFAVIHNFAENNEAFTAILELAAPGNDPKVYSHLLGEVVRRALAHGAYTITARTASADLDRLLVGHGFRVRTSSYSPITYKYNVDTDDTIFADSDNWYLSQGDGDGCYYF